MKKVFELIKVKTYNLIYDGILPQLDASFEIINWEKPKIDDYLEIYKSVGAQWGWTGRLLLPETELERVLNTPTNEIYLFKAEGVLKGFFEIDRSQKGKAEIVYLGLLPNEIGKGYGKAFLKAAIYYAGKNNDKIWLHTCEFDHPNALSMYVKTGFVIETETIEEEYYQSDFLAKFKK